MNHVIAVTLTTWRLILSGTNSSPAEAGKIGDKVHFELSVSFHQLGLSQLQFCPRGYYPFSSQCYGTFNNKYIFK
jgi:hypothetical protein